MVLPAGIDGGWLHCTIQITCQFGRLKNDCNIKALTEWRKREAWPGAVGFRVTCPTISLLRRLPKTGSAVGVRTFAGRS
jgi:hypothetical protein